MIDNTEKLRLFSNFETTLLEHQIKVKEERIKKLRDDAKGTPFLKLPIVDRKKLYRHYKKKLKFYGMQDNTKWQSWPAKTPLKKDQQHSLGKKNKNYKKRVARRTRQTKKDAEKALNSGAVVVLVEEEVPLGAIAALGKGLGYVPTPTSDNSDERLQMRRVVNRILDESRKRCTEESAQYTDEIPAKLRSISYSLRAPAPDKQVNTMVDRLVAAHDAALLKKKRKMNRRSNLSKNETDGLKWLKEMSAKGKISVVQADNNMTII